MAIYTCIGLAIDIFPGRLGRGGPGGGSGGPSGLRAPPNNRGPAALGLAALLFAIGVFVTIKLGIVANEIG